MNRNVLAVLVGAFLIGCSEKTAQTPAPRAESNSSKTNSQIFEVRGVVQEVKPEKNQVVIKHEDIPNYMPAMTMPFDVKTAGELAGIAAGDEVKFRMVVLEDEGWIEDIQKIGTSTNVAPQHQSVRLVREVDPLQVGDTMPDYSFTNSLGNKFSLSTFKGQALAITFIFTRCPFPNFCPRMSRNFEEAYEKLSEMKDGPTNWHLISLSFDPEYDTPARLKQYSAAFNPDPKRWDFATGAMMDIDAITEQLGLYFAFNKGTYDHNLRTVVINADGKVQQIYIGNEWKPEELVEEMVKASKPGSSEPAHSK
jgi:protein SCO1/2